MKTITNTFFNALMDFIEYTLIGSFVFIAVYVLVGQMVEIDGSSMLPNFHHQEKLVAEKISINYKPIKRGDVVVFRYPLNPNILFIKRVIGLPGETFTVKEGFVYINSEKLEEPYLAYETVTKGKSNLEDGTNYIIPENGYVLLGDNREESSDSRNWGYVKKDYIIAKALLVFWPINNMRFVQTPEL